MPTGEDALVAIAYPDGETAERVRPHELLQVTKEHLIELEDAVVVEHQADGNIKLRRAMSRSGAGAPGGALWGGLIGLIFLAPLVGMAVGAASGAVAGRVTDVGVNDNFLKELGEQLPAGGVARIVLGRASAPEKVIERVRPLRRLRDPDSMDDDAEEHLRAAFGEPAAQA